MAIRFDPGQPPQATPPVERFDGDYVDGTPGNPRQYHVAPDGHFLFIKPELPAPQQVEAPPPWGRQSVRQLEVVLNWTEELKRLVQTR